MNGFYRALLNAPAQGDDKAAGSLMPVASYDDLVADAPPDEIKEDIYYESEAKAINQTTSEDNVPEVDLDSRGDVVQES